MPKLYRSREGEATAVYTRTQLTTLGSEAAPGPLLVPQGVSKLVGIIAAAMSNHAATGSYSAIVRIEGPGLPEGPETCVLGAGGVSVATGGRAIEEARELELDVAVQPGSEIIIVGEMCGADVGQVSFGVTLVFE